MRGGSRLTVQIALDFHFPARSKAIVIEQKASVQLAYQVFDVGQCHGLAALAAERLLEVGQRARAVHQRHQHRGRVWQHDRARKSLGIAQREHHLPVGLVDRKTLDAAQSWF